MCTTNAAGAVLNLITPLPGGNDRHADRQATQRERHTGTAVLGLGDSVDHPDHGLQRAGERLLSLPTMAKVRTRALPLLLPRSRRTDVSPPVSSNDAHRRRLRISPMA